MVMVFNLICVAIGLAIIVRWRTLARDHLEFQRHLLSKPHLEYDQATLNLTTFIYLIAAIFALAIGVAGMLGFGPSAIDSAIDPS